VDHRLGGLDLHEVPAKPAEPAELFGDVHLIVAKDAVSVQNDQRAAVIELGREAGVLAIANAPTVSRGTGSSSLASLATRTDGMHGLLSVRAVVHSGHGERGPAEGLLTLGDVRRMPPGRRPGATGSYRSPAFHPRPGLFWPVLPDTVLAAC
jgi:hypothetical protein